MSYDWSPELGYRHIVSSKHAVSWVPQIVSQLLVQGLCYHLGSIAPRAADDGDGAWGGWGGEEREDNHIRSIPSPSSSHVVRRGMGFRLAFHGARFMWLCHNLPAVTKTENRDSVTVSQILTMSESRASVRLSAMGRVNVSVISMVLWKHNSSWPYSAKHSDFSSSLLESCPYLPSSAQYYIYFLCGITVLLVGYGQPQMWVSGNEWYPYYRCSW